MKNVFKVEVPKFIFPGFYNTDFDPDLHLNEDEITEENYIKEAEAFMQRVFDNIISHYKEVLPDQFKLLNYELVSPREYNYINDKIVLEIETEYEAILFYFFNYEKENLLDYVEFENYHDDCYPEALLETLLEFWPFIDDLYEETLRELFIYG